MGLCEIAPMANLAWSAACFDQDGALDVDLANVCRSGDLRWRPSAIEAVQLVNDLEPQA